MGTNWNAIDVLDQGEELINEHESRGATSRSSEMETVIQALERTRSLLIMLCAGHRNFLCKAVDNERLMCVSGTPGEFLAHGHAARRPPDRDSVQVICIWSLGSFISDSDIIYILTPVSPVPIGICPHVNAKHHSYSTL